MFWVEVTRGCDGLFAKSPRKRREEETADQANGAQQNAVDAGHSLQLTPHLASLPQKQRWDSDEDGSEDKPATMMDDDGMDGSCSTLPVITTSNGCSCTCHQ